ncbi:MarR family winged helix-turn-helix transcriptional regulator [Maridesulfovibrio salexigens]|uniref:HTH-type transcriptional regulator SarZ n=1 Tax=Maridesulfovibrio salexigens (strain ATCC 14822 / DSM 2638 / NCIMB 8403 / VKM B-1763) TaxID=526222 RepID=C6BXB9_MARSD|nr:MarR family winged helix-turn-helix transcriptional regulator [Maridesulfovibrio salexigens]ACS80425.1 transcriptional regulator, MarR family [Maridesulfovibrio salexigens DSM 2638]
MSYANKMVIELLRLGAYLQREGARVTREFGLAQQQFVVLVAVKEQGPVSQKAILSDLLYEKSNVSKSIARLSALGLIQTSRSVDDSRVVLCEVTEEGRDVVERCMVKMKALNEKWLQHIPEYELRQVVKVLGAIRPME